MTTRVSPSVLANTAVSPGTYGGSTVRSVITVDNQGRLTYAANLAAPGVTAGTYGGNNKIAVFTVNTLGELSFAANTVIQPGTGGGNDSVFIENGNTVTQNYTITTGKNAMSTGPITINSGVTVTVPTGSRWVVL